MVVNSISTEFSPTKTDGYTSSILPSPNLRLDLGLNKHEYRAGVAKLNSYLADTHNGGQKHIRQTHTQGCLYRQAIYSKTIIGPSFLET